MSLKNNKIVITVKEYAVITAGILIYVLGWTIFMLPNNLVGGGVSGLAAIAQYATRGALKSGTVYFVLNLMLLIMSVKTLGRSFSTKTLWATIVASVGLNVLQDVIPFEIMKTLAIDNGKLMSVIMTGLLVGLGVGISMSQGGSTGGTDIIALMISKKRNITTGRMLLAIDAVVIGSSLFIPSYTAGGELVPFAEKITTVVYGFILIFITSTVLDLFLSGTKQSIQIFITSRKYELIADGLIKDMHRGVTVLDGMGWYTKQESHVLMVVSRKTDQNILLKYIKSIDPDAFITVANVTGVYGRGFEELKMSSKK